MIVVFFTQEKLYFKMMSINCRALDWQAKGRGFDFHGSQAKCFVCPAWTNSESISGVGSPTILYAMQILNYYHYSFL